MSLEELEAELRGLLKGKFSSLHITFNEHACNYCSVAEAIEHGMIIDPDDFVSAEEREKAIATDSVWQVQWYPETPVGFCNVAASTLSAALTAALAD